MEEVTGILTNVGFGYKEDPRYPNIFGRVKIDNRGRFYFGELVYTSTVQSIYKEDDKWFAQTRYSLYELEDYIPDFDNEDFKSLIKGDNNA